MDGDEEKSRYKVKPYTFENLQSILLSGIRRPQNAKKSHLAYFQGYFDDLSARTIVLEHEYVDRDYLEDFSGYYVRCFSEYPRVCTRLHFFSIEFNEDQFSEYLSGESGVLDHGILDDHYLGFVVLKPLPSTFIGRTCLKTYASEGRRHYPITRRYTVNLFGSELSVESLAFQEQDTVVAACATSALWSAFHCSGKNHQHAIPSPLEITRAAMRTTPSHTRAMPNRGLNVNMMAQAIRHIGLEPLALLASDDYTLTESNLFKVKALIFAYLRAEIPIIMGIRLFERAERTEPTETPDSLQNEADSTSEPSSSQGDDEDSTSRKGKPIGYHAVTITGFSLPDSPPSPFTTGFMSRSSQIDKIYVHDDQVGPFARMEIEAEEFLTHWADTSGEIGNVYADVDLMILPVYHKIRIPFDFILDNIIDFDNVVAVISSMSKLPLPRLVWDIQLTTANDFRKELRSARLEGDDRQFYLTHQMPRFVWRARAYIDETTAFDILFDATDLEQGTFGLPIVVYDDSSALKVKAICSSDFVQTVGKELARHHVYEIIRAFANL